jgi:hypothetical protein
MAADSSERFLSFMLLWFTFSDIVGKGSLPLATILAQSKQLAIHA